MIDAILLAFGVNYYFYHFFHQEAGFDFLNFGTINMVVISLAVAYVLHGFYARDTEKDWVFITKTTLLMLIILLTVVFSVSNQMILRLNSEPHLYTHDHPLQLEAGLRFLTQGKNPYTENYLDTPMPKWNNWPHNPAIHHFVTPPGNLLLPMPVFTGWQQIFGWYDHRIINILFLFIAIASLYALIKNRQLKLIAAIALVFNPLFFRFFIEGMGDIMFFGLVLLSLALLRCKKMQPSLIVLALAMTVKQTAVFIAPFYFFYLWQIGYLQKKAIRKLIPFTVVLLIMILPFVIWDARSLFDDTYGYPAGTLPTSYPISGYGIAPILVEMNIIADSRQYFPFAWLQIPLLIPLLIYLIVLQRKYPRLSQVMLNYGLFLWVFWIFSRFFNINYMGVVVLVLSVGTVLYFDELAVNSDKLQHKKLS